MGRVTRVTLTTPFYGWFVIRKLEYILPVCNIWRI